MTRAQRSEANKQVAKILNEVGEVGPMDTVSDERLLKLVKAGTMQLTSLSATPEEIWLDYNHRADMENRIAELKHDRNLRRSPEVTHPCSPEMTQAF